MHRSTYVAVAATVWLASAQGQAVATDPNVNVNLNQSIASAMATAQVPGLAVVIVKHGHIVYSQGYGWADLASSTPVTGDTAFRVASVSKSMTATALMQLADEGKFNLDDDIDHALGFSVRAPNHQHTPLTYRMLLTHTAAIADNYAEIDPLWNWDGDSATPLASLARGYFGTGGSLYSHTNFLSVAPGTTSQYSNMGIALAGYLVEVLSGKPFAKAVNERIFAPLHLTSAAWSTAAPLAAGGLATLYQANNAGALVDSSAGAYTALPQYGYPEVPAGMLRISANDLARFMILHTQDGSVDGVRILRPDTAAEMHRVQLPAVAPDQGLVFYHLDSPSGHYHLVGHNGGDPGVSAEMYWVDGDPNGLGVIILGNSDATSDDDHPQRGEAVYSLLDTLLDYGSGL